MNIDFNRAVPALGGGNRKDGKGEIFRLKDACITALDSIGQDEQKLDAKEKYRRGDLARRIFRAKGPIGIESEDVTLLKASTAKVFASTIIIAEIWDMLDPKGDAPQGPKEPASRIPGRKAAKGN
jgi:hypothetical protein